MARPRGTHGGTLDDAITELQNLVNLAEVSNDLQRATQALLTSHRGGDAIPGPPGAPPGPPRSPGGPGGGGTPTEERWGWTEKLPIVGGLAKRMRSIYSTAHGVFRQVRGGIRSLAGRGARLARGAKAPGAARFLAGAGRAAGPIAAIVAAVVAMNEFRKAVEQATEETFEHAKNLAKVSGSMAAVIVERDVRQMLRDIRTGEALAPSTKELADAEHRRKEAMLPIEIAIQDLKNGLLTFGNGAITAFVEPISKAVDEIRKSLGGTTGATPAGLAWFATTPGMEKVRDEAKAKANAMMAAAVAAGVAGTPAPAGAAAPGGLPFVPPGGLRP